MLYDASAASANCDLDGAAVEDREALRLRSDFLNADVNLARCAGRLRRDQ